MKGLKIITGLLALFSLGLSSCKKSSNNDNDLLLGLLLLSQGGIPVRSAQDLTNESDDDYSKNNWGLVEHSTLQRWVGNWSTEKPGHIPADGKLIILHLNLTDQTGNGTNYIPSNTSQNVYSYELDDFRFNEQRDNGLISESVAYQASGARTDQWLKTYGINLNKDLVVFASANGTNFTVQDLTRGIYWLRYWGADIKHLALLNGNLRQNATGWTLGSTTLARNTVDNGGFSVKQLRVDHTILTLPLEDVLAIVDDNLNTNKVPGITNKQLIIDARPTAQFNRSATGTAFDGTTSNSGTNNYITTSWASSGAPGTGKTYVLWEGHINGATSFPWADLLQDNGITGTGAKYKSKSDLRQIFADKGYTDGTTIVSQCRTNFEVQVNGFAAQNILGYPTVFYDGSLVEWTSLVSAHPNANGSDVINLQESDPAYRFRTDTPGRRSANFGYNTGLTNIRQAKINRNATTTRKLQNDDKAYKF